jgi:hypothetical protein
LFPMKNRNHRIWCPTVEASICSAFLRTDGSFLLELYILIHGVLDSEIGIAAQELEEGRFTDHISTTSWRNDMHDSEDDSLIVSVCTLVDQISGNRA